MDLFMNKSLVTLRDISEQYSIPLSTLRKWASERRFSLYKISNMIRVSPVEFEEWIASTKIKPYESGGNLHE